MACILSLLSPLFLFFGTTGYRNWIIEKVRVYFAVNNDWRCQRRVFLKSLNVVVGRLLWLLCCKTHPNLYFVLLLFVLVYFVHIVFYSKPIWDIFV